ncbi:MAG: hypothetical protein EZS28_047500 [Streblomastix strix]|uniref:KilA-N domain-containing protein n=1 Tax=Streblomastix strix TaxID=222440 RepID=A0A5J4TGR1_9EUKA|nr:MAG: hypothetical protein EZS28_047500 [Streblomastix strix]
MIVRLMKESLNDEDARLELMEQFDEEIEDIIRDVKKMESTLIEDSQQTFIKTSYNGIEIIVRQSDGYVNVSKMVVALKHNERSRIASLFNSNNWKIIKEKN